MANLGTLGIPGSELFVIPPANAGGFFISLWSGPTTAIPAGWQICDGSGGTPDLRDKFLVGAGSTYAIGATGGATTITPSGTNSAPSFSGTPMGTHSHTLTTGIGTDIGAAGSTGTFTGTSLDSAGTPAGTVSAPTFTGDPVASLPPYYALCFIAYVGGGSV